MNKLFSKIAALSVGLAMAVGVGVAVNSGSSKVEEVKAAEGDVLCTFSSDSIVTGSGYTGYSDDDWELNIGGNNVSAGWNKNASNARQVGSTFAIDSQVTATTYGWVASTKNVVNKAGKLEFSYTGGSGNSSGKLWLGYSTDGTSYSKVELNTGTQGSSCGTANTTYTFEFDTIDSAYYAIIVTGGASGSVFRFDNVTAKLFEGATVDPSLGSMTIMESGNPADGSTIQWSSSAGIFHFTAEDENDVVSGVTWSTSDSEIATINSSTGYLTTVKPGSVTVYAEAEGYNKASASITISKGWKVESVTVSGTMSKTTYTTSESWSNAGLSAIALYNTGWEEDVASTADWSYNPASPAENVTSVVATATFEEVSGSSSAQAVTVTRPNPIQDLYSKASGASVDVYGYYVGFLDGTGPVIMDGDYGVVVYNKSADVSGYTEKETILHVTGSISIYKGLYEIGSPSISVASEIPQDKVPSTPVVYATKGGETAEYASRLTTVTGTPAVVSGSFDSDAGTSDITMNFTVGTKTIQVFYKKAAQTADADAFSAIKAAVASSEEITIKGFTGWYNAFQVQMNGVVEAVDSYTAEQFAQDLLDQTDAVCSAYPGDKDPSYNYNDYKSQLVAIWSDLASADKYPSLPSDQKEILANAARDEEGSVVEQAMARYDFLTGKYELSNFINGRTPMANHYNNLTVESSNNMMIIIVVISSITVLSLGILIALKKKKHN